MSSLAQVALTKPAEGHPVFQGEASPFSLGTPVDGQPSTPMYSNFSPLFSSYSSSSAMAKLPPVAPIPVRANGACNRSVLSPIDTTPSSYIPSFLSTSIPVPGSGGASNSSSMHNSFIMDPVPPSSAYQDYRHSLHILQQTPLLPVQRHPGLKRRRMDLAPSDASLARQANVPIRFRQTDSHSNNHGGGGTVPTPFDAARAKTRLTPIKADSRAPSLTPEKVQCSPGEAINTALRKGSGSSCHQCKNRREAQHLNFCKNRTRSSNEHKSKKICRKKFCDHCILKFCYQAELPSKSSRSWECPSCTGICVCAACRRKNDPTTSSVAAPEFHRLMHLTPAGSSQVLSPTLSFAHKLLYQPGFMTQAYEEPTPAVSEDGSPFFKSAF